MYQISHFVGLSGIGGVQRNFVEYFNYQIKFDLENKFSHKVYTLGGVDCQYKLPVEVHDIRKLKNFFSLILDIISRKKIVHFYNNLTSFKLAALLFFLPVYNIIFHERGAIWNFPRSRGMLLRFIAWKSRLILTNSNATKIMLEKKFNISSKKMRVLHNGIDISTKCTKKIKYNSSSSFRIGFLGRLDTPKGVHVLIEAMRHLVSENIELTIAGDGDLDDILKKQAYGLNSVFFIGRIEEPYSFLSDIDLLVVPSIREPLGNVCLEAGLCKVPVLASNVDGIPEIIDNKISGELIDLTVEVAADSLSSTIPLPEFVVDGTTNKLHAPKQIDSFLLAKKILELSFEYKKLDGYSDKLHDKVSGYFTIDRYAKELHNIYDELNV